MQMRKRFYAGLIALSLSLSLSLGCLSAFASGDETEGALMTEAAGQAQTVAVETEAETEADLLKPESVTGDTVMEAQYPAIEKQVEQQLSTLSGMSVGNLENIEKQVEQQLSTLSGMSVGNLENMINGYNRQINLSVLDIRNSMEDSSTLTEVDDATMAMVKMLRNWYSNMDSCGEFKGIKSYTADMTDQVLTMELDAEYAEAEKNDSQITVGFTYDLARNVTLLTWTVKDSFSASVGKAGMNTVIGLGTVFVVLLFLTFIISQIHWIPDLLGGKKKEKEEEASVAVKETPAPAPVAAVEIPEETDDLELIAVISAAIAASEQAPADGFVVRSIRRRGRKSNWRA